MADDLGFKPLDESTDVGFTPLQETPEDVGFTPVESTPQEATPASNPTFLSRIFSHLAQGRDVEQQARTIEGERLTQIATTPLLDLKARDIIRLNPKLSLLGPEAAEGAAEELASAVNEMSKPGMLALMAAAPAAPEIAAGVFAGLGAKQAGTALGEQSVAAELGDEKETARQGVRALLGGMQAAVAPLAVTAGPKIPATLEPAKAKLAEAIPFAERVAEKFTPPNPHDTPELRIDATHLLPRLQDYATEKSMATSPEGMARVPVIGTLMDPRANIGKPELRTGQTAPEVDAAIITRAHSVSKGRTLASLWAESQFRNKDLFVADKDGTLPLTNGERGYMSDVIEAEIRDPGSQRITPEQRAWINDTWKPLREDLNRMLEEEGVKEVAITEPDGGELTYRPGEDYFPRPAIGKRGIPDAITGSPSGGRPGSAPSSFKSRYYETEFEGARAPQAGEQKSQIIYDPNAISRVTKTITGVYRAIADHRLANDPSLGGVAKRDPATIAREVVDTIDLESGAVSSKAGLKALSDEIAAQLTLNENYGGIRKWGEFETVGGSPAFAGKIYPIETVKKLHAAYGDQMRGWVKTTRDLTQAGKAMVAAGDMSAPMVQGAAMLGRSPLGWGRATLRSYQSLFDPNVMGKMLEKPAYQQAAKEFSQSGGSMRQLSDFLSGAEHGSMATRIPGFGHFIEATGRAYGTFLDLAKLELWRAYSPTTPKAEWPRLAESIENSLFMGRMESIGLNPHRAVGERLMAFAPAYYRGAGNLISNALQHDVSGKVARDMIGGYIAAGMLLTVGGWVALGLSEEEMLKRLDPRRGTFLKVPIELGDSSHVEVGFGNILTQLARLAGQAIDYQIHDKPIDTGVEGNPYLRFLQGRAATLPAFALEIFMGKDFMGEPISIKESLARRLMPFAMQALWPREEGVTMPQRVGDAAFSFFGLNAFPESEYASQLRSMDRFAQKTEGGSIFDLPVQKRAQAVHDYQQTDAYKKREATGSDMRRFIKMDEERRFNLRNRLTRETKSMLDSLGLNPGTYKSTLTIGGVNVPLSRAEQERYEVLIAESMNSHVADIPAEVKTLKPIARAKWWEKYGSAIREEARKKLLVELAKPKE